METPHNNPLPTRRESPAGDFVPFPITADPEPDPECFIYKYEHGIADEYGRPPEFTVLFPCSQVAGHLYLTHWFDPSLQDLFRGLQPQNTCPNCMQESFAIEVD